MQENMDSHPDKKLIGYIDCAPTWTNMLPLLMELLSQGTMKGRAEAMSELHRMAALADRYVSSTKT